MSRVTAAGDDPATESLLRDLLKPGYRLAYMMLHDREAAEDAVQEAAIKSWRKLSQLRAGSDPRPWFLGFVANECRNARRLRWRSVITLGLGRDLGAAPAAPGVDLDLQRALARLVYKDQLVILLHYYFDLTSDEIAAATGWRSATARSRLHRAVKRLKSRLALEESQ